MARRKKLRGASKIGGLLKIGQEPILAPGVRGILFDEPDGVTVTAVFAEKEGDGAVSAWLDGLPKDRQVTFTTVLNPRLGGMLARRGYEPILLHDPDYGTYDGMRREPSV